MLGPTMVNFFFKKKKDGKIEKNKNQTLLAISSLSLLLLHEKL